MEVISNKKVFSLLEVTTSIQKTLAERYKSSFWVKAEMNKLNHYPQSGHCYPELVEKKDGRIIAQIRSNLWKNDFQRINKNFLEILKEPLKDGINILFCASIHFDPSHGLFLRILEVDPSYTLGELQREKQETLERLEKEGIYHKNKQLRLALVPQHIAVVSVETSKGYSDYLKVIEQNPWGYKFFNMLFPAILQGDKSVTSIIYQLGRIRKVASHFDAVAIIRGGGGDVGLSSYNNYRLAKEIALFPIPVITGIGHSTNETVAEMVAFKNAITPTELADFLIQKFHDFSLPVKRANDIIIEKSQRILKDESLRLKNMLRYFQSVTNNQLIKSRNNVAGLSNTLIQHSKFRIRELSVSCNLMIDKIKKYPAVVIERHQDAITKKTQHLEHVSVHQLNLSRQSVEALEKNIRILDPVNILRRGFSITLSNGKSIKHYSEIQVGDAITTILAEGKLESDVKNVQKPDREL